MDRRAMLRVDIGFYRGTTFWILPESLCGIHVLVSKGPSNQVNIQLIVTKSTVSHTLPHPTKAPPNPRFRPIWSVFGEGCLGRWGIAGIRIEYCALCTAGVRGLGTQWSFRESFLAVVAYFQRNPIVRNQKALKSQKGPRALLGRLALGGDSDTVAS